MPDSLVISNSIELINDAPDQPCSLPGLAGVRFVVDTDLDLGTAQPIVDILSSMVLDGERPWGRRSSNRSPVLPINIIAPTRDLVVAAREYLMSIVDQDQWPLTWTREGASPVIFDCYRAQPSTLVYQPIVEMQEVGQLTLNLTAAPYGRSDVQKTIQFATSAVVQGGPAPTVPPAPVQLDMFTAVGSGNPGWTHTTSESTDGGSSLYLAGYAGYVWLGYTYSPAAYTGTFSAKNLTGQTSLSLSVGLTPINLAYLQYGGIPYGTTNVGITLFDASGHNIVMGATAQFSTRGGTTAVQWTTVNIPIPASPVFDFTHVTGYQLSASNQPSGGLAYASLYFNDFWAKGSTSAPVVAPPSARGAVYTLNGIVGSQHAPMSITVQQGLPSVPTTVQIGPGQTFTPPAGVNFATLVECFGPGGAGSSMTTYPVPGSTAIAPVSGAVASAGGAAVSSLVIPSPAGVASGQLMIMTCLAARTGAAYNYPSAPAGWTALSAGTAPLGVFSKVATGSEPLSYTIPLNAATEASAAVEAYSGTDGTVPVFLANDSGTAGGVTTFSPAIPAGILATDMTILCQGAQSYATGSTEVETMQGSPFTVRQTAPATTAASAYNVAAGLSDMQGIPAAFSMLATTASRIYSGIVAFQRPLTGCGAGGGGGSGGYAAEANVAMTPGAVYTPSVPAASTPGTPAPGDCVFTGDAITITAHGGTNAPANSQLAGTGGAASSNTVSRAGASGYAPVSAPASLGGGGALAASSLTAGVAATGRLGAGTGAGSGAAAPGPGTSAAGAGSGGGGGCSAGLPEAGGSGGPAMVQITYYPLPSFKTAILHRPSPNASPVLCPCVPLAAPGNGVVTPVPSNVPGFNARFNGTYTLMTGGTFNSPATARTVTVTVYEWAFAGASNYTTFQSISTTLTPANDTTGVTGTNGLCSLGELTLPNYAIAADNTATYYTCEVVSTNPLDTFTDILFLDTMGQTLIINSQTAYAQYYYDEPSSTQDVGNVLGTTFGRAQAISVMEYAYPSGGPLVVEPATVADSNELLAYCMEGAPALIATYFPRWFVDRILNS